MDFGYILYSILGVVILGGGCVGWWSERKRLMEAALHAPLLLHDESSSADARVESALRAASEGSRACPACSFENLQRSAFCAICSARFDTTAKSAVVGGLTDRQRRVRLRKQWQRETTEAGAVRWRFTSHDVAAARNPSIWRPWRPWVLRLEVPAASMQLSVEDDNQNHQAQSNQTVAAATRSAPDDASVEQVAIDIPSEDAALDSQDDDENRPNMSLAQVAARLAASVELLTVSMEDADTTDAAQPSIRSTARAGEDSASTQHAQEIRDTVAQARLAFPTKLAQFITASATLFSKATNRAAGTTRTTRLSIDRQSLLRDSIASLATLTETEARAAVRIEFVGDQGVDAGGVYREWFLLFNEQIIRPDAGVFECVNKHEQTFYLNPQSRSVLGEHHLTHAFAVGRALGRALLEGNVTGFHLALPLLKIIVGQPIAFDDLKYFDPDTHKSLQWLLNHDRVDALGLDFSVVEKLPDNTTRMVELCPGGSALEVNDDNKREFVDRKLKYLLVESVAPQLLVFLQGLYEVIPADLLMLFDAEELDFILSGSDSIDIDDWERNTKRTPDLFGHPALKYFWEVVREMTPEERRRLLQFSTGSSRVPPAGFAALSSYDGRLCPFTLHGVGGWEDGGYVRSHACFNRLDLPRHRSKKGMQIALSAALLSEEMGFTTQ